MTCLKCYINFKVEALQVTTLACLVAIGLGQVKIQVFTLSRDLIKSND